MNASRGSELTKFILKRSPERCHQSRALSEAVKRFLSAFICFYPVPFVPQQMQYPAHLICSHYGGGSYCYLFPYRRPWAVYSTCASLASLPSTTYLFITDSRRDYTALLRWQTTDFRTRETNRRDYRQTDQRGSTVLSDMFHWQRKQKKNVLLRRLEIPGACLSFELVCCTFVKCKKRLCFEYTVRGSGLPLTFYRL